MKVFNLQTEFLSNPIGVSFVNPIFLWNVSDCKKQTAYQIKIYVNGEVGLDTGKINSSSTRYQYLKTFNSRDVVVWHLKAWDENDKESKEETASFEIGLLDKSDWKANWIKGDYKVNKKKRYPVDYFKKEFEIKNISNTRLYVSSLGLYEAYINGNKVGKYVLTPGSTDYNVRVQYDTYDVSSYLKEGKNEIVILLADGWYRGSIGAKGFTYVFGKESKVIAQIENNGSVVLKTDNAWLWSNDGPILFSDLKDGEVVDNNLVPSYKGHAKLSNYKGEISSSNNYHVEEVEYNSPINEFVSKTNKYVYEFKNNVAGYISLKVNGKKGDKIHLVMGEMLDENNDVTLKNVQCIRKGKKTPLQEITFICKEGLNEYKSKFFYGGFKYVSVESDVKLSEIKQVTLFTNMKRTSEFECSDSLINIFHENTVRSLMSNSIDIPTDCPTRERMGWTGDSQIIFNTASYLFDYHAFANKHLRDIFDRQKKNGCLPQIAPYSAEDWFMGVMNGSVGWADVGVLIPYRMYLKYGDKKALEDNYEDMVRYAKFMIKRCGRAKGLYALYAKPLHLSKENRKYGVNTGQSYGEWAEPNDVKAFEWTDFAMPHPEESMAYTSYIMSLMVKICEIIGKEKDIPLFEQYSEGVKKAYQELVNKPAYTLDTDRQAKLVRPLYMNLLNEEQAKYAKERLIKALDNYDWKLGTGFLSTPFILDVLQDIDPQYAYKLLENKKMPGWLYMAINNTGTIWEGWEGPNSEKGIASLNHYSKGAMVEWLYSSMLGIRVVGENRFEIKPVVGGSITFAKGSYQSIYGKVYVSWKRKDGKVNFEIEVPSNVTACFEYQGNKKELQPGKYSLTCNE